MVIDSQLIRLLSEIGFIAGGRGLLREAETIFEGIRAVRPQSEMPFIGLAIARMSAGQSSEAIKLLRDQALRINPASDDARNFLGLALRLEGRAQESEAVLREVAEQGQDERARTLARSLLAAR